MLLVDKGVHEKGGSGVLLVFVPLRMPSWVSLRDTWVAIKDRQLCGREEEWFGGRHRMKGTTASGCGLLRGAVLLKLVQSQHLKDVRTFRLRRDADRNSTHTHTSRNQA